MARLEFLDFLRTCLAGILNYKDRFGKTWLYGAPYSATCYDKCISHVHVRGPFSADPFFTYIYVDRAQRVNVKHVIFVA